MTGDHKRSEGGKCKGTRDVAGCQQTEAACAFLGGCCSSCSHWLKWTADGEPATQEDLVDEVTAKRREQWRERYRQRRAS